MPRNINFDYFYGGESELFSYYRIPRLLVTGEQFRSLSTDAKLLYGLMLDRMGLSMKNRWYDASGRVFIYYPLEEIMDSLNCGHNKAVRLLAELDTNTGIGLIERIKQGQGRPTIIYVKRFTSGSTPTMVAVDSFRLPETGNTDFPKTEVKSSPNGKSRLPESGSADFPNQEAFIYSKNYLDNSYLNPSIHPSIIEQIDGMDRDRCRTLVKEHIGYLSFSAQNRPEVDELLELITDVLCSQQASFRIGGVPMKSQIVKERLAQIQQPHIEYVLDCMRNNTTKVRNIRGYLLTTLYNAPTTIEHADLPIVGGSILSHEHFQGGHYSFPMERAPIEHRLIFDGYADVNAGIVKWPMSVIRITCPDKDRLADLATKILNCWKRYTDKEAYIYAKSDGEPHNTITPIARRRGEAYELDLVLRNNITSKEHPLGVYHPHSELHHIKKENIGLIEVMGLAVLPARLKLELGALESAILHGDPLDGELEKHRQWVTELKSRYAFTPENTANILKVEVGKVFAKVLEHAGVYKRTETGLAAFFRFIAYVNQEE